MLLFCSLQATAQNVPQLGKTSINDVIKAMTIEEKISLLVGAESDDAATGAIVGITRNIIPGAAGTTVAIPRLGIPATVLADGPAGLRIASKREGTNATYYCTHFPVETLLASTWNTSLVDEVGQAMGKEVLEYGVDVLLAPATNIMRNPLCGRNFEYYSEDPLLAGKMAAAMIRGVQSNGVGTSLKHYAANNQEINRTAIDARISPRPLREIYLKPFEIAVKEAQPWTIMTSYNKLNGTYTSQRADLVTSILRDEWGFKGLVMTDWHGGIDAVEQVRAGNDLMMPGTMRQREQLRAAILAGTLSMRDVDASIRRMLEYILRTPRFKKYVYDNRPELTSHANVTRQSAAEGMVLLENRNRTLPLDSHVRKAAVFGITSYDLIAGGTGSGDVNHAYVVSLTEGLENTGIKPESSLRKEYEKYISSETPKLKQLAWFMPKERITEMNVAKDRLQQLAKSQDVALITIGKTSGEFVDRKLNGNFNLTEEERKLIDAVCEAFHAESKKVIVILNVCGVVETASWSAKPDAVLVAWMAGQEGGNTIADILTGKVNPSGKLPMTFPMNYADVPSAGNFANPDLLTDKDLVGLMNSLEEHTGDNSLNRKDIDYSNYEEGVFVGYRYYDTQNKSVSYPFGYGLSYTDFTYSDLKIEKSGDLFTVTCVIKNQGNRAGKEVVQLYVSAPGKDMPKPVHELKAFAKTQLLQPGESETIQLTVNADELASFSEDASAWVRENGVYEFRLGASSRDIRLRGKVEMTGKMVEQVYRLMQNS